MKNYFRFPIDLQPGANMSDEDLVNHMGATNLKIWEKVVANMNEVRRRQLFKPKAPTGA